MLDALILGAGISGLAAGHRLRSAGLRPVLLEASNRSGGTLRSRAEGGFRFETGPNTVIHCPEFQELCVAAHCADDLQEASPVAKRRFLVYRGQLEALPASPPALITTPLLPLASKLRLLAEPLQRRGTARQESVRAFVERRFGRRIGKYFADVMVYGVYAGLADELVLEEAFPQLYDLEQRWGSILRGMAKVAKSGGKRRLVSFRGGFGRLAERLAEPLEVRYGNQATAIGATAEGFRVTLANGEALETRRLITALPAVASGELLRGLGSRWQEPLHAPVAVVGLGFDREAVGHALDGFGFLAPPAERRAVLGCLFSSTLFPDTAPTGAVALTAMVGGRARPELLELDDATLTELVLADLGPLLDIRGEPQVVTITRWRPGIPQPTGGRPELQRQVGALQSTHPGLQVLGNWLHGVSVPDCLRAATGLDPQLELSRP